MALLYVLTNAEKFCRFQYEFLAFERAVHTLDVHSDFAVFEFQTRRVFIDIVANFVCVLAKPRHRRAKIREFFLDSYKFGADKIASVRRIGVCFVLDKRKRVLLDESVYILSRAVEKRTNIAAAHLFHTAKTSNARSADYAHKYSFRLVIGVMRKRDIVTFALLKNLVENLVSQNARALLCRVAVSSQTTARRVKNSTAECRIFAKSATNLLSLRLFSPLIPCSTLIAIKGISAVLSA